MRIIQDQVREIYPRHYGIKCWTCNRNISKTSLKSHMGHDVTYLKESGERDD